MLEQLMRRGTNATNYDRRSRLVARATAKATSPAVEAKAWMRLVRRHRFTPEEARRAIGVTPEQIGVIATHWHQYRNEILERFNAKYPGGNITLENATQPEQHRGRMFSRKPELVAVKMLVSIAGLADPDVGPRDWSFDAGEITSLNSKRAEAWQNAGKCVILTAEQAKRALEHPNGDHGLDDLESILRASGRCAICDKLATRVLGIQPLCASCYGREVYARSAVGEPR